MTRAGDLGRRDHEAPTRQVARRRADDDRPRGRPEGFFCAGHPQLERGGPLGGATGSARRRCSGLHDGVAAILPLLGHVVEHGGVARQLLHTGRGLPSAPFMPASDHAQRYRGEREHLAAPGHGLTLQIVQRDHGIDESPVEGLLRPVPSGKRNHTSFARLSPMVRARMDAAIPSVEALRPPGPSDRIGLSAAMEMSSRPGAGCARRRWRTPAIMATIGLGIRRIRSG